jgi:SulP family sulfate permease
VLTLGILAWRAGSRGVVGSVQDAAAAVLAGVAGAAAAKATALQQIATIAGAGNAVLDAPDPFLSVVAATLVVTVLCGVLFLLIGTFRLGNLIRLVPYPVIGGFLAGTGWLLLKGGIYVASGIRPYLRTLDDLIRQYSLYRWVPAFVFGVVLLVATRIVRRPLVIPAVLVLGVALFALGMLLTGSTIETAKQGRWLLGPFESTRLWEPWTYRAIGEADWSAVLGEWPGIATAVFVALIGLLLNVSGSEILLRRDLDSNRELRDAGFLNVVSGAVGGIPGYHALSLTSLAERMSVSARTAGLIAMLVPLAAVVFGAGAVELIPRVIVGGVLVFLGLAFLVEWVWDKRKVLPLPEYLVVLVILGVIVGPGFLPGVVIGLILACVLLVVDYGRIELVRELEFGEALRSNVDRPRAEQAALGSMRDRVQILRLHGFVFFGTSKGLLDRIRSREEATPLRFLVLDLRRVAGLDSSAVLSFVEVVHVAQANGFEVVFTGVAEPVRRRLERGGVVPTDGLVRFEPDLDRGLQVCEESLLGEADLGPLDGAEADGEAPARVPARLLPLLERMELTEGTVLIRQNEPSGDVFILESGRLAVELETGEGTRMRLRTMRPGVVVGEVAYYTGERRTADVMAETPSVVLRLTRDVIERVEAEDPELAAEMHRWLASAVANRFTGSLKALDALLDA